jgi:hypothetical protein
VPCRKWDLEIPSAHIISFSLWLTTHHASLHFSNFDLFLRLLGNSFIVRNFRTTLGQAHRRDLLLQVLERVRRRYRFVVVGYVVMPEHMHLLLSEDGWPILSTHALCPYHSQQRVAHSFAICAKGWAAQPQTLKVHTSVVPTLA